MPQGQKDAAGPGGLTRLFVDQALAEGREVVLGEAQSHYLAHVLRAKAGDRVRIFNGRDGEWRAAVHALDKRKATLKLEVRTAPQADTPDLWLVLAPIKKTPLDYVVQKATELGVRRILPVFTRRTVVARVNAERMRANAIEAAEQSGRLTVPDVDPARPLEQVLGGWRPGRPLMFCDESGEGEPAARALARCGAGPWAILTGPEGGFAPAERDMIRTLSFVVPVSLGPRIMRADTAALAAVAIWQSTLGDWN